LRGTFRAKKMGSTTRRRSCPRRRTTFPTLPDTEVPPLCPPEATKRRGSRAPLTPLLGTPQPPFAFPRSGRPRSSALCPASPHCWEAALSNRKPLFSNHPNRCQLDGHSSGRITGFRLRARVSMENPFGPGDTICHALLLTRTPPRKLTFRPTPGAGSAIASLSTISSSCHSLFRVLYIFPLRYLFAIGLPP